jgi:hypothetical protein
VQTLRAVLLYLYTGRRNVVTEDNAMALLAAADYLLLDLLKQVQSILAGSPSAVRLCARRALFSVCSRVCLCVCVCGTEYVGVPHVSPH